MKNQKLITEILNLAHTYHTEEQDPSLGTSKSNAADSKENKSSS